MNIDNAKLSQATSWGKKYIVINNAKLSQAKAGGKKNINNNYNNILALTYLSSFPLPNFLLGSLKEFPGLDWSVGLSQLC